MGDVERETTREELLEEIAKWKSRLKESEEEKEKYKAAFEYAKKERDSHIAAERGRETLPDSPPENPMDAAAWLINAKGKRSTNAVARFFGGKGEYEYYDIYSIADLRQIAGHLLVYCNAAEDEYDKEDR